MINRSMIMFSFFFLEILPEVLKVYIYYSPFFDGIECNSYNLSKGLIILSFLLFLVLFCLYFIILVIVVSIKIRKKQVL
jgi:hypothetical protein